MEKNIIYKCNKYEIDCEHLIRIPTTNKGYIIPICNNIYECENKTEVEINTDSHQYYECFFMRDNHTFVKCSGALKEIRIKLSELFEENKYGGWGHLKEFGAKEGDNLILGLEYNLEKLDELIEKEN